MALTVAVLDTAIESILTDGQSFTIGDVTYNMGNVNSLKALRDKVMLEEERSSGDRPAIRAVNFGTMGY